MSAPLPAPRPRRTRCPAHRSSRFRRRWPSPVWRPTVARAAPTHQSVRGSAPASVSSTASDRERPAPSRARRRPATRSSEGIGCDLLSRCATSQTRGAGPPRVATRLTAEARRHGIVSTPSPSMRHDHRPRIARPSAKTSATKTRGLPAAPSHDVAAIVIHAIAPPTGVPYRPGSCEYSNGSSATSKPAVAQHPRAVLARLVLCRAPGGARRSRQRRRGAPRPGPSRHARRSARRSRRSGTGHWIGDGF